MTSAAGDQQQHGSGAPPETPLDLEPLAEWCGGVLSRGLDDPVEGGPPAADSVPPLPEHLRGPLTAYGFDDFDLTVLALALASDLDPVLGAAMSVLTGQPGPCWPTLAVISDLIGAVGSDRTAVAARLCEDGPLSQVGLVHIVAAADSPVAGDPTHGPSMRSVVVASTALLRWTFGITLLEPGLFPHLRDDLISPAYPADPHAADILAQRLAQKTPTLTSLLAPRNSDGLALALYSAALSGRPVLAVDGAALTARQSASRIAAEALLREAVVVVTGDIASVPPHRWESLSTTVVVGAHPRVGDSFGRDVQLLVVHPSPGASTGSHLVDVLRGRGMKVEPIEAGRMARWEHLPAEDVGAIAGVLVARVRGRHHGSTDAVTADDVTQAALEIVDGDLARLSTRLETSRDWSHFVVPQTITEDLTDLLQQAAGRAFVLDEMGFSQQPGQPRGVTAVFAGPSGTGKTMAARLVAGELGLPLYRVDLARTVSKYIGETERNLDAVFAAAERSDAVLLFDEAESLFGKRSEVQDAHDRYANLEIAFLLQRMESYEGVAILATNLLGHLDDAFARRLSFCIHFPFPEEAQRALIWRTVWPDEVSLADDLDLESLAARHPLSGGHIRNIAVAAVHLARARGVDVNRACVDLALGREYSKLGLLPDVLEEVVT